jgi:predicted phosphodiesterase
MGTATDPIIFVWPGDLHFTQPDLDNHKAAHWMVNEVNTLIRPDFVQFAGDNVQHATEEQFAMFKDLCGRLTVPYAALVGDHDVHHDPRGIGYRRHVGEPYGADSRNGYRFIRLNTLESRPVGITAEQIHWFRYQVDAAISRGEKVVVFMHHYPFKVNEAFDGPGLKEWREIVQTRDVVAIFSGHTHYGQAANDGRNVYFATRSIGEPEGGAAGYAVAYLHGDDLAVRYRSVQDQGPFVLITHPREAILCTGSKHIVNGPDRIVARIWSASPLTSVQAQVDGGAVLTLEPVKKHAIGAIDYEAPLNADTLSKGEHGIELRATDADGRTGIDRLRFVFDRTGRYTAVPRVDPPVASTKFC